MENQTCIKGYRTLSIDEISAMNTIKDLSVSCGDIVLWLENMPNVDQRCVDLAKANLQQGFMWAIRAIARPTTF